jgi:hypothetical protein
VTDIVERPGTERPHLADRVIRPHPLNITDWQINKAEWTLTRASGTRRRKVAIVGAGFGREQAPYDDPEWEVWALNVVGAWDREGRLRADRWFELHERKAQSADDLRWIAKVPCPIYVPDDLLDASPMAVRFPVEMLEGAYGGYFTCTFAYQLALALAEGFHEVGLYGVELAFGTERERTVEWACVSWWMGFLEGRGVRFSLPVATMLGHHAYRYGLQYDEEKAHVERYLSLRGRVQALRELVEPGGMGG